MSLKILYVGALNEGSTSLMRYITLKDQLKDGLFYEIDTSKIISQSNRIYRILAYRFKTGPLVKKINKEVKRLTSEKFDMVWVDKGIFIHPKTLLLFKPHAKLIHYTPDAAFHVHNSFLFNRCIPIYDYCITTKSFEKSMYKKYGVKSLHFYTQAYDKQQHFPINKINEKDGVAFIGRWEKNREIILNDLLKAKIKIKLAGNGWKKFAVRNANNINLAYYGDSIYGKRYREIISSAKMAIGFLSELLPELHTTRTFEIPACGTALITKKNEETSAYFKDDEAIFYTNSSDMIEKINYYNNHTSQLNKIIENGHYKVSSGNYSYDKILSDFLKKMKNGA